MQSMRSCLLLLLPALMAAAEARSVEPIAPPAPPAGPVVILARHALDGRGGELHNIRIGVSNGRITSLSASGAHVIDLRRYTVLPGWIDVHVHLASHFDAEGRIATDDEPPAEAAMGIAQAAWDTLMGGFTTVQSVGDPSEKPLRDAVRDHGFPGPRILTSLAPIEGDASESANQLRAEVHARKVEGADLIKIFASASQRVGATPTFTEAQLKVLCDEARKVGLRSMVHAYRSQVAAAARAGCNEIEHMTYATDDEIAVAAAAGAYLSPQVGLVVQNYLKNKDRYLGVGNYTEEGMITMERDMPEDFRVCSVAMHISPSKVVFSTDATAGAHGHNAEEFIGRVEHCGQSPMAALVSANAIAAAALGMQDRLGALAPGFEADVIALDGDPVKDLTAVRRVVFVMRGGVVYKWPDAARPAT
ncbi:MAG: amidohydrolase family protein [Sinobacteraceae bacterium]|nr:amidohydrolase family protein [Nevskiaceae bacterium]